MAILVHSTLIFLTCSFTSSNFFLCLQCSIFDFVTFFFFSTREWYFQSLFLGLCKFDLVFFFSLVRCFSFRNIETLFNVMMMTRTRNGRPAKRRTFFTVWLPILEREKFTFRSLIYWNNRWNFIHIQNQHLFQYPIDSYTKKTYSFSTEMWLNYAPIVGSLLSCVIFLPLLTFSSIHLRP